MNSRHLLLITLFIINSLSLFAKEKNLDRNLRAASRWIKVARIQSTNPIDGTEKSSISGTLNLQADINHTGDQQYFATFSFGVRSGNKVTIKPLLVEYGGATIHRNSSTAITWNVYKDKQGMHYLWLQQPQYSSYGVFNYEQIGCREYWTIENPPSDYELVWSSSDGERQVSNGYYKDVMVKNSLCVGGEKSKAKIHIYNDNIKDSNFPSVTELGDVMQFFENVNNGIEIGNASKVNERIAWILARHSDTKDYGKYYSTLHLQPNVGNTYYRGVAIGYPTQTKLDVNTFLAVNGKVGICNSNPTHTLDVNGTIRATEIIVSNPQTADFVFEEDYNLRDLDEVESFITKNKHLPGVPSAKKMIKEGTDLAQMNRILLQKIEELTLYTIKQQKELEEQKKEIIKLKNNK